MKRKHIPFKFIRWITVYDRDGTMLGKVEVCVDTRENVNYRLTEMGKRLKHAESNLKAISEIDTHNLCLGEQAKFEQFVIRCIKNGFGANSVDGLFSKYRPFTMIAGKTYFELLVNSLLKGTQYCINNRAKSANVTI